MPQLVLHFVLITNMIFMTQLRKYDYRKRKEEGKDQDSMQSSTTPDPGQPIGQ